MERLTVLSDGQSVLCFAGDFNSHTGVVEPGEEESTGIFGRGTRNREGRELVEMLMRKLVGGREDVLPEGEQQNHLHARTE